MPLVLNAKQVGRWSTSTAIYVGRPSIWGNRYIIGQHGTREQVVEKYAAWILGCPEMLARLSELKGKDLICWCAPMSCHGHILLELANNPEYGYI